jgi:hypothetical protein
LRYTEAWRRERALFADDPRAAVFHIDTLVQDVIQRCGYPVCALEQNAINLSEDRPRVIEQYRTARELVRRQGRGERGIEDLRKAMGEYQVSRHGFVSGGRRVHQCTISMSTGCSMVFGPNLGATVQHVLSWHARPQRNANRRNSCDEGQYCGIERR